MKIGSLFSGVAGLDRAVESFFDADVAWFVEFDKAPSKALAHHYPGVPNYGDVTAVDWANVEPIDILTGGFPCQDVSLAGARRGLRDGTRSGLWSEYAKAIDILRPKVVVIENVRGLLSARTIEEVEDAPDSDMEPGPGGVGEPPWGDRPVLNAFGRVLGDLAELGYDAEWVGLRAADAGAPHNRFRVFIVAHDASDPERWGRGRTGAPASRQEEGGRASVELGISGTARLGAAGTDQPPANPDFCGSGEGWGIGPGVEKGAGARGNSRRSDLRADVDWRSGASVTDASRERRGEHSGEPLAKEARASSGDLAHGDGGLRADTDWGPYRPAIARWEHALGRVAPSPTRPDGRDGGHRLNPELTEWMMGWPAGWVTDPAIALTRNEQLKACGNGVVTQQALLALETIAARNARAA